MKAKSVLVAPLDWGLGHATRCIPIIQFLIDKDYSVSVASNGSALKLLKREFPQLEFYELPSYNASYSYQFHFMINIFFQLPKFLWAIMKEKRVLKSIAKENPFDLIISDNRYGCRLTKVPSVIICHHINIIMPRGLHWVSPVVNFFNHRWIAKFDICWIPDDPNNSLTGKLSFPDTNKSKRIGTLSRFIKGDDVEEVYQLAVVLSGPEPQRTIFEKMVVSQLSGMNMKTILVRGMLDGAEAIEDDNNLKVVNHLSGSALQRVIEQASVILCRSGYSSVMDLAALGKKAIFVPTPGQTEQEYLGYTLMEKKIAYCQEQNKFDLHKALNEYKNYTGFTERLAKTNLLDDAVEDILK